MHPKLKAVGYAICAVLITACLVVYAIALTQLDSIVAHPIPAYMATAVSGVHLIGSFTTVYLAMASIVRALNLWRSHKRRNLL